MTEFKTRSEKNAEVVEKFLDSNSTVTVMLLYGSEIKKLEKKFPVLITKNDKHGDLYTCFVYKKSK